jgi:Holliday junction DNA helicase RuvA
VLELKDKVAVFAGGKVGSNLATSNQVENALQGLGYSSKEAAAMLNQVVKEEKIDGLSAAQILKLALKNSGKQ